MRRAIVHIGTPRTGTTTLQRILSSHRGELERRLVLYPDLTPASAAEPHLSHQHLGEALAGRRPARERRELLDRLDRQMAATSCDTVVLSYEALCLIPAAFRAPQTLAELFARHGMAMQTVLTIKPQAEYLNSTYTWRTQFLREGRPFRDFVRGHVGAGALDYERLAKPWRAASAGRLTAIAVRDPAGEQPLVGRVFAALGLAERVGELMSEADLGLVENRSPGPVAVEICRQLCAGGAAFALESRSRAATRFVEQVARAQGYDSSAFMGLDDEMRAEIEARWRAANARFAERVWGAEWAGRVACEPPRPANEIAGRPISAQTASVLRDMLQETLAAFCIELRSPAATRLLRAALLPLAMIEPTRRRLRGLART